MLLDQGSDCPYVIVRVPRKRIGPFGPGWLQEARADHRNYFVRSCWRRATIAPPSVWKRTDACSRNALGHSFSVEPEYDAVRCPSKAIDRRSRTAPD